MGSDQIIILQQERELDQLTEEVASLRSRVRELKEQLANRIDIEKAAKEWADDLSETKSLLKENARLREAVEWAFTTNMIEEDKQVLRRMVGMEKSTRKTDNR